MISAALNPFSVASQARPLAASTRFGATEKQGEKPAKPAQDEFILVTGGAGYIGSVFVNQYLNEKPKGKVIVVDDLSEGHRETAETLKTLHPGRVKFIKAKIGDRQIKTIFKKFKVNAVVHYAASASVPKSQKDPMGYLKNNVSETIALLDAMKEGGVKKFIFSSTAATYGNPTRVPITETQAKKPVNVYGKTKLMVEEILRMLHERGELSFIALRYFNAAGADPGGKLGEKHRDESHLIPLILQSALQKRPALKIFGDDYPTPDGTCVRDYIHVSDLADAHIKALDYLDSHPGTGKALNLGTGSGNSVQEVINACREVTGKEIPIEKAPRRDGDPAVLVASPARAMKLFNWKPKYGLKEIIRTAWNWEKARTDNLPPKS